MKECPKCHSLNSDKAWMCKKCNWDFSATLQPGTLTPEEADLAWRKAYLQQLQLIADQVSAIKGWVKFMGIVVLLAIALEFLRALL